MCLVIQKNEIWNTERPLLCLAISDVQGKGGRGEMGREEEEEGGNLP